MEFEKQLMFNFILICARSSVGSSNCPLSSGSRVRIAPSAPLKLSSKPLSVRQWLDEEYNLKDVFEKVIAPHEYLFELVS